MSRTRNASRSVLAIIVAGCQPASIPIQPTIAAPTLTLQIRAYRNEGRANGYTAPRRYANDCTLADVNTDFDTYRSANPNI